MKHILLATTTLLVPAISSAFVAPSGTQSAVSLRMSEPNYYNNQDPNYYNQDPSYYNQGSNYDAQYAQQEQQQNYYEQGQQYDQQQQQYDPNQQYNQQQQQQEEEPTLFLSNNMQEEFTKATADFATPIDFLALARQRAAEKRESINSASTDEDWRRLAEEKKMEMGGYFNEDEGWEKSLEDEGNESDVAGLGMGVTLAEGEGGVMVTESGLVVDGGEDEDGDEPKLLLY